MTNVVNRYLTNGYLRKENVARDMEKAQYNETNRTNDHIFASRHGSVQPFCLAKQ